MPQFPALPPTQPAEPRCVAHLAFAEILVIWALRLTMKAARGLAVNLLLAEQPVLLRDWDFAALASTEEPRQQPAANGGPGAMPHRLSPTLH